MLAARKEAHGVSKGGLLREMALGSRVVGDGVYASKTCQQGSFIHT